MNKSERLQEKAMFNFSFKYLLIFLIVLSDVGLARPIFQGECGTTYSDSGVGLYLETERLLIKPVSTAAERSITASVHSLIVGGNQGGKSAGSSSVIPEKCGEG